MTEQLGLSAVISGFLEKRKALRLEKLDKEHEKLRKQGVSVEQDEQLQRERDEEIQRFVPATWLSDAAVRAKQISFATHPLKFTHPDARGSSGNVIDMDAGKDIPALCTSSLSRIAQDVVGNAAALDVAALLQLEENGISLARRIAAGDISALAPFASDISQLNQWQEGLSQALSNKALSTHGLAKQVYFPVTGGYHLLSPLFSSAMAQAVHQRISESRYSESAVAARKARRENQYSATPCIEFSRLAVQAYGGTKPQNVSQLNLSRGGKSFMFRAEPPAWREQFHLPSGSRHAFWKAYSWRVYSLAQELGHFLQSVKNQNNIAIRDKRASLVDQLIDELFQYAAEIQTQTPRAGWSSQSALSCAEQLWLDPQRPDADFQKERAAKDWCADISGQFAFWLNRQLQHHKLPVGDIEYLEWQKVIAPRLNKLEKDVADLADLYGAAA